MAPALDPSRDGTPAPAIDPEKLGDLLERYRPRLRRLVSLRLDPRLRRRVDSSDVVQEAYVDAMRRFDAYRAAPKLPFNLWLRLLTAQKLTELTRRHMGAHKRDVRLERADSEEASSVALAHTLARHSVSPSQAALREERAEQLHDALERLKPIDREVLMLRHFERLSNADCAQVLGLSTSGAKLRHLRAVQRLRQVVRAHTDLPDDLLGYRKRRDGG